MSEKTEPENIIMIPYHAHDHSNRHKVHIQQVGKEVGALCGFYHKYYSSVAFLGVNTIDENWLNQTDPDHVACKHCIKIARKKLNTNPNTP